jgi:hypothetical protein
MTSMKASSLEHLGAAIPRVRRGRDATGTAQAGGVVVRRDAGWIGEGRV